MVIITDTREIRNQHILATLSNNNISFRIQKLHQGDYSMAGYENKIIVERKSGLLELSGSLCQGRKRFEAEFVRAKKAGAKIYLLIEDADGKAKMVARRELDKDLTLTPEQRQKKTWRSNFSANSMIASLASWKDKYDLEIVFVDKKHAGAKIIEIFQEYLTQNNINML
jgi:ERCC4-type nuclease